MEPTSSLSLSEAQIMDNATKLYQFDSLDLLDIGRAKMLSDFGPIVSRVLDRYDRKFAFILSPRILGTHLPEDLLVHDRVCQLLRENYGVLPFYHLAFEQDATRLQKKLYHDNFSRFDSAMAAAVYLQILKHRRLAKVVMMQDWQKSELAVGFRGMIPRNQSVEFVDAERNFPNLYRW